MDLQTAADRLGVHYQTAYRWVRDGSLRAVKRGSVYEIDDTELSRFQTARASPAPPPKQATVRSWSHQVDRLYGLLVEGDELGARQLVDRLHEGGIEPLVVCESLLAPTLARVGDSWAKGNLSVAEEHRAAQICERLIARLAVHPRGRPRGVAVVGTHVGEEHSLPAAMAALVLRADRWQVHHLGTQVPTADLLDLVRAVAADLVVLSPTNPLAVVDAETVAAEVRTKTSAHVLVGAPGATLGELVASAATLGLMRLLFATWWGGGNVTPVRVLTRELVADGHDVRVLGPARLRAELEDAGADYVEQTGGFTASPDELRAALDGVDAVIVDFMMPDLLAVAEASGKPWAPLVHTLAQPVLDDEAGMICAFLPLDRVNEVRRDLGLSSLDRAADALAGADRILVVGPESIDRPLSGPPLAAPVRHLGAIIEPPPTDSAWSPPPGDGPLVLVCMGTTPMDEAPVLQRVLDALGQLPVRGIVTAGSHLEPASLTPPPNVVVTGYVPHASVLPSCDLVITHAGLGTVTASLAFGVPVLCVPLGRDQHLNATRVDELGAGAVVASDAGPAELAAAVTALLADDDDVRRRVRALAARIQAESVPGRALAELVELAGG